MTNVGPTAILGDLGVSQGTSITGFGPGVVLGTTHDGDAVAMQAHLDAAAAYMHMAGLTPTADLTGRDLGGMTLTPGVYRLSTSAQLTGILTLDAQGQAGASFIFQVGSTLTTAAGSSIVLVDGASSDGVGFQVGTSATLGTGTIFAGTILASTSDVLATGVHLDGRVIALGGAVTLDDDTLVLPNTAAPEPSSLVLSGLAAVAGLAFARARRNHRGT